MGVIKFVLSLIGVLCVVAAFVLPVLKVFVTRTATEGSTVETRLKGQAERSLILLVVGVAFFLLSSSFVQVEAGYVGVVKKFGAVTGKKFEPGLHLKLPIVQTVEMYRTQRLIYETSDNPSSSQADYTDFSVNTMTEDGQRIKVRFTVAFAVDGAKADWVAQNIGTEANVVEKVVKANARSECRNIPKSFRASDLYGKNIYLCQQAIFDKLKPVFEKNGVVLDEFLLRDIGFDENLAAALEEKQIALEKQVTAQRMVDVKTAEASQTIAAAKGSAEAAIAKARGDAEAIRLVNAQLSNAPWYNQYILNKGIADGTTNIEWAMVPSGSTPLVDFRKSSADNTTP
jgi:regulator of protease activity HflC (stomatin/prohibitin superfamily)